MTDSYRVRVDPIAVVDGAQRSGRFHPSRRDHWLREVSAGGRRGGKVVADLICAQAADRGQMARWDSEARRVSAAGPAEEAGDLLFLLYPEMDRARAAAELDRQLERQAAEVERFIKGQYGVHDNQMRAAAPAHGPLAASAADLDQADEADYRDLFG